MNWIRKYLCLALTILLVLIPLAGCGQKAPDPERNRERLEFPGTHWLDSPEAVKKALAIPASEVQEGEEEGLCSIRWTPADHSFFGIPIENVMFLFHRIDASGDFRLHMVEINYPENAEMNTVRREIGRIYGAETKNAVVCDLDPLANTVEEKSVAMDGEDVALWQASTTMLDGLGEDRVAALHDRVQQVPGSTLTRETLLEYLRSSAYAQITWTTNAHATWDRIPEGHTANQVIFTMVGAAWYAEN